MLGTCTDFKEELEASLSKLILCYASGWVCVCVYLCMHLCIHNVNRILPERKSDIIVASELKMN